MGLRRQRDKHEDLGQNLGGGVQCTPAVSAGTVSRPPSSASSTHSLLGTSPWPGGGGCPTRRLVFSWPWGGHVMQLKPIKTRLQTGESQLREAGGKEEGDAHSRLCPKCAHPPWLGSPCHTHIPRKPLPVHLTSFPTTSSTLATFLRHHHFSIPQTRQAPSHPRTFALAVPSAWNIQLQTFLCTIGFFSSYQPPSEVSSERPSQNTWLNPDPHSWSVSTTSSCCVFFLTHIIMAQVILLIYLLAYFSLPPLT